MKLAWTLSTSIIKGYREVKTRITKELIETSKTSYPFGFSGNPTKNFIAILADTQSKDEPVVVGYLDPRALESLNSGDSMQYATDEEGNKTAQIILRSNNTAEILGNTDNAVRYSKLESGLSQQNTLLNAELLKIQTAISGLGGAYARTDVNIDISESKIDEIKLP